MEQNSIFRGLFTRPNQDDQKKFKTKNLNIDF